MGNDVGAESSEQRTNKCKCKGPEAEVRDLARRPVWLGRGSKGKRGWKKWAWRGQVVQGLVKHGESWHFMLFPRDGKPPQGSK